MQSGKQTVHRAIEINVQTSSAGACTHISLTGTCMVHVHTSHLQVPAWCMYTHLTYRYLQVHVHTSHLQVPAGACTHISLTGTCRCMYTHLTYRYLHGACTHISLTGTCYPRIHTPSHPYSLTYILPRIHTDHLMEHGVGSMEEEASGGRMRHLPGIHLHTL